MGGISKRLIKLDPTLKIHNEGEWTGTESKYFAFNDAGLECEVGEFMYSMVRVLKPTRVLETGTHWGIGASYIGLALKDNGFGILDTVELLPEIAERARIRMKAIGIDEQVTVYRKDVASFMPPPGERYNMILLDTEPDLRFKEFVRFYDFLFPGGFIFIHDLHHHMSQHKPTDKSKKYGWPFGKIPMFMVNLIEADLIRLFHFPTPRGLVGIYKVAKDDYRPKTRPSG